ncbi:MAG: alpha/beta hydrolase [Flavobacteriaceae bacterium]
MKQLFFVLIFSLYLTSSVSQEVIKLPYTNGPLEIVWEEHEKNYFSELWQSQVVTNVSIPTMEVFRPKKEIANGISVIIAPGGGLFALSIESEGNQVAKWLNQKGITAFVLKYRLAPTGKDGVKELSELGASNPAEIGKRVAPILPLSIADGLMAISHVRENAATFGINPDKIGFMGFSAGGAVTMGVTFNYTKENRPDFIVPIYPWMNIIEAYEVPKDAPPMLVICASDDPLELARASLDLYSAWLTNNTSTGLHMYSKGGHGFGMKKQGLPSDNWIQRFYDWSIAEGITPTSISE